jgi:hypothetical protein
MRILLALLLLATPALFAQTKPTPPPSKVFVKANDIDCDTDRFRSRMVRQLKSHGLVIAEKESEADFLLLAALEHGVRPIPLIKAKISVSLTRRGGTPFTTTTTWSSTVVSPSAFTDQVQETAAKNIVELGTPVHTVQIGQVDGIEGQPLREHIAKQGYQLVDADADVTMSVKAVKADATEEEDFAISHFEIRTRNGELYTRGNMTSSDPHFYQEPVDVIASVAMKTADNVPSTPASRITSPSRP